MKIKTFSITGVLSEDWDEVVNDFLKGKKIHDVKLTTYMDSDGIENNNIIVIYE